MGRVPRARERTAPPEELVEDRRRCLAAKEPPTAPAPTDEGNLCSVLRLFAAWRPCSSCGARVLFVDEQVRTDSAFLCGRCESRRKTLGRIFSRLQPCRRCGQLSTKLVDGLCFTHHQQLTAATTSRSFSIGLGTITQAVAAVVHQQPGLADRLEAVAP